jgi:hypothetical protein
MPGRLSVLILQSLCAETYGITVQKVDVAQWVDGHAVLYTDIRLRPSCGLNLLERQLVESHATVIIPLDDRVLFVSSLNCAEFSSWLSEVAQTLDTVSGCQFLASGRGLGERWLLGTV